LMTRKLNRPVKHGRCSISATSRRTRRRGLDSKFDRSGAGKALGQSKPNATKQDQDDDGGQDAHDESGCKPNWQGETASCGVSELHLALVGDFVPSSRHQFLGALVVGSVELCRELPTVLGKLSILGNCFHALRLRPPGAAEQAERASQPAIKKKPRWFKPGPIDAMQHRL
jgi:hypothetical protein